MGTSKTPIMDEKKRAELFGRCEQASAAAKKARESGASLEEVNAAEERAVEARVAFDAYLNSFG